MIGALWVCERDIRKFVRQPAVMATALVGPLLMLILLGYAFGGSITRVPVAVVRYSEGTQSSTYLDILRSEQNCALGGEVGCAEAFRLREVSSLETARLMLQRGQVKAIVYIPDGFDGSLDNSNTVFVTLYLDNTDPLTSATVSGGVIRAAQQLSTQIQVSIHQPNIAVDQSNFYRNILYVEFMAPGSIVQAIFVASIIGGGISILMDRQRGVLEGYIVTPLEQHEIVLGVLLAGVIKAVFSSIAMLFLAIMITGIRPTADVSGILLMLFTILLTALGVISMMTAFAVRVPAAQVYQLFSFPINLILYFTSGAIYPIDGFPDWMRTIAVVNPEVYAVHALRLLMYKGADLSAVLGDFAFLATFTAIMCTIAIIAFRRAL